ncbi:hypothetical protein TWF281_009650 [Arthrobotrys megalospora]
MATTASKSHSADWEAHRKIITDLYHEGQTQSDIQKHLEDELGFRVSIKQLEYRLKVWGLRKNITKAEYQYIQQNVSKRTHEEGKETDVLLNGVKIQAKKLKRNLTRYGSANPPSPTSVTPGGENMPDSTKDITIMTPEGSPEHSTPDPMVSNNVTSGSPTIRIVSPGLVITQRQDLGPDRSDARADLSSSRGTEGLLGKRSRPATTTPREVESGEDSDPQPSRQRPRRLSNVRNLGSRYACPWAKGEPDAHVTCWTINRQNLAGVKEHLKRFHFGGTLPRKVREARTWDDTFDTLFPDWGFRPRPSPYVDMLDIFQRSIRPQPPPPDPHLSPSDIAALGTPVPERQLDVGSESNRGQSAGDLFGAIMDSMEVPSTRSLQRGGASSFGLLVGSESTNRRNHQERQQESSAAPAVVSGSTTSPATNPSSAPSPPGYPTSALFQPMSISSGTAASTFSHPLLPHTSSSSVVAGSRPSPSNPTSFFHNNWSSPEIIELQTKLDAARKEIAALQIDKERLTSSLASLQGELDDVKEECNVWKRQYLQLSRQNRS